MRVLVTGATGKIGRHIVRRLLEKGIASFSVRALVRGARAEQALRQYLGSLSDRLEVLHGDIEKPETLSYSFRGIDSVIIATGPTAHADVASFLGESAWGAISFGAVPSKPSFWFEERAGPKQVDYFGQVNQINAAKAAGARHIVLLSSMGGTKPDHFINEKMADIAVWKRKAEHVLVKSGLPFTIMRAGGLLAATILEQPQSRAREIGGPRLPLEVRVDDEAVDNEWEHNPLPLALLGDLCVECLQEPTALNRSFDLWSRPARPKEELTKEARDVKSLLARLKGRTGSYEAYPDTPRGFRKKKPGLAAELRNIMAGPPLCGQLPDSCDACECKDLRGKSGRPKDVEDAEAPGMNTFDEQSIFPENRPKALNTYQEETIRRKAQLNDTRTTGLKYHEHM